MNRIIAAILFVGLSAHPLLSEEQRYVIAAELSSLTFDVDAKIHHVHGVSREFSGEIIGDPEDFAKAKISVRLNPKDFDTANKSRDKVMREKSLEVEKFPFIEFTSTAVEASENKLEYGKPVNASIKGILTLHGVGKELTIPVKIYWDGEKLAAEGNVALLLDDWKIYRPKILFFRLENDIKIHFRVGARKSL